MGIHIYLVSLTDLHDIFPDADGRDSSVDREPWDTSPPFKVAEEFSSNSTV